MTLSMMILTGQGVSRKNVIEVRASANLIAINLRCAAMNGQVFAIRPRTSVIESDGCSAA